jgi:hypothetical protein
MTKKSLELAELAGSPKLLRMKTKIQTIVITIILILVLLTSCKNTEAAPMEIPANAKAGEIINLASCTYEARDVEFAAECGDLVVLENRHVPNSRLITIPITRILWEIIQLNQFSIYQVDPANQIPGFTGVAWPGLSNNTILFWLAIAAWMDPFDWTAPK